jgi:hypothetical protein
VGKEVARIYRARWRQLLVAGFVVFAPLALVELIDEWAQHPLLEAELDEVDPGTIAVAALAGSAHAFLALVGEVFYTGVVAAAVIGLRAGEHHSLRHLVAILPWRRLIAIDLILSVGVALGLLLLIVPGLLVIGWYGLAPPIAKVEGQKVLDSLRRSRQLVRGHVPAVLAATVPIAVVSDALETAVQSGTLLEIGESPFGDWAASVLSSLVASPFLALVVVVIYFELADRERSAAQTASR